MVNFYRLSDRDSLIQFKRIIEVFFKFVSIDKLILIPIEPESFLDEVFLNFRLHV